MSTDKSLVDLIKRRRYWRENPHVFFEEVLGIKIPIHQKKMLQAICKYDKVGINSANSVGKSFLISAIALWYFFTHVGHSMDEKTIVIFTAPTFPQVKDNTFANLKYFFKLANKRIEELYGIKFFDKPFGDNQNKAEYWFNDVSYIRGMSTDKPNNISGVHAENLLVIFDEAQGIKPDVFSGFNGVLQSGQCKQVLLGNTTLPQGPVGDFYDAFKKDSPFNTQSISAFDTPNFIEPNIKLEDLLAEESAPNFWRKKLDKYTGLNYNDYVRTDDLAQWSKLSKKILPYTQLANPIEAYDLLKKCGMNPNHYEFLTRVLSKFPDGSGSNVFDMRHVETSMNNYHQDAFWSPGPRIMGVDVAGGVGRDKSAIAVRDGNKVIFTETYDCDTKELKKEIVRVYKEYNCERAHIERDGIGKPLFDLLEDEPEISVIAIIAGGSPGIEEPTTYEQEETNKQKIQMYNRKRDELWMNLADLISPITHDLPILLPPDDDLRRQMGCATYRKNDRAKIVVLPKEEMKKLLKKSPDKLDSILMAFADVGDIDVISIYGFNAFNVKSNSWS